LSDARVIEHVNAEFVPLTLDVNTQGFPADAMPALAGFRRVYNSNKKWFSTGFASCSLIDPTGKHNLGSCGPLRVDLPKSCGYEEFIAFVAKALQKWEKLKAIDSAFNEGKFFAGVGGILKAVGEGVSDFTSQMAASIEFFRMAEAADMGKRDWVADVAYHGLCADETPDTGEKK